MLSIRTFGALAVELSGEPLPLPASRKTRALLGYLVLCAAPRRREQLCELFWGVPDDPRGALRWSLSKLRPVVNAGGEVRLIADRERVSVDVGHIATDFHDVAALAARDGASADDLAHAWSRAADLLLEDCELPNQPEFADWLDRQRNEAVRLRIRVARRLALSDELDLEDRERWAERWLLDAPFDPAAAQQAVLSRRLIGREREAVDLARNLTGAFREAGLSPPEFLASLAPAATPEAAGAELATPAEAPHQAIRFARADDGITIAWASVGNPSNPPLLKAANWLSHLELDWEAPIWSPLFRELARSCHLVRYDERGCGLSDWDAPDITFEQFVTDLELVADAAGLDRFPLLGISQGAAVSIEFAARHPERVSRLILFGGYAAGWRHTATPEEVREREAVMVLTETGWGRRNPSYRHLFSQTFMPGATPTELAWFDEFQRRTTSPENAVRFLHSFADIDVRDRLKDVRAPTLVVHSRHDQRIPVASARALATGIPNAEFAGLESENHLLLGREPASLEFLSLVRRFLQT